MPFKSLEHPVNTTKIRTITKQKKRFFSFYIPSPYVLSNQVIIAIADRNKKAIKPIAKPAPANATDIPMVLNLFFCFTSAIIHKTKSTTKTIKQIKQVTADIGKKTGCSSALLDAVKLSHAVNIKNPKDETIPIIEE